MTETKRIIVILISLTFTTVSHAQPIQLNPVTKGYKLNLTAIDQQMRETINTEEKNIQSRFLSSSKTFASSNGDVLFSQGKLINMQNEQLNTIDLPQSNLDSFEFGATMSGNGNWLIYKTQEEFGNINTETVINYFNLNTGKIEYQFTFQGSVESLNSNINATMTVFSSAKYNNNDFVLIRENRDLNLQEFVDVGGLRYYSNFGNRVFGYSYNSDKDDYEWVHVNRKGSNWSNLQNIKLLNDNGNILQFHIVDIANDGKTLLVNAGTKGLHGLAVVHEENGEWSVPQYIGGESEQHAFDSHESYQISENGNVVAVQDIKRVEEEVNYFYDALLYFKTESGSWKKQQVNPPEVDVLPDILLTDDGTKLFWLPRSESSVSFGELMR